MIFRQSRKHLELVDQLKKIVGGSPEMNEEKRGDTVITATCGLQAVVCFWQALLSMKQYDRDEVIRV